MKRLLFLQYTVMEEPHVARALVADQQLQAHTGNADSELTSRLDSSDQRLRALYQAGEHRAEQGELQSDVSTQSSASTFNPYPAVDGPSWEAGSKGTTVRTVIMQGWLEKHSVSAPSFLKKCVNTVLPHRCVRC